MFLFLFWARVRFSMISCPLTGGWKQWTFSAVGADRHLSEMEDGIRSDREAKTPCGSFAGRQ
jgi:hypothetical protein